MAVRLAFPYLVALLATHVSSADARGDVILYYLRALTTHYLTVSDMLGGSLSSKLIHVVV